ncbi:MAG: DUF4345 domain-containing protein [Pseudomonadota bacterium]
MSGFVTRSALVLAGALLAFIGGSLMLSPVDFLASSDIRVADDPSLLSELIAPTGVLLSAGASMLLGAVKQRFTSPGLAIGAFVYGSYGISRLFSIAVHGMPGSQLTAAMCIELGFAGLLGLLYFSQSASGFTRDMFPHQR